MVMSMDSILGQMQGYLNTGMAALTEKGRALSQFDQMMLIAVAVIGLLFCFFGLKMVRFWAAVFGLAVGFSGGAYLASYFGLDGYIPLIIGAVAGIILAVLGARFFLAGVFLVMWILGIAGSACILQPKDWKFFLVCAGIGLVVGLITLKFAGPVTMLITSIFGGFAAGQAIYILLPLRNRIVNIAVIAVLVILGIIIQFLLESKKRKKQHLKKAEEIRNTQSVANEVDKARAMVDNLDQAGPVRKKGSHSEKEDVKAESEFVDLGNMDEEPEDEDVDEEYRDLVYDDIDEEYQDLVNESGDYDEEDIDEEFLEDGEDFEDDDDMEIFDLNDDEK